MRPITACAIALFLLAPLPAAAESAASPPAAAGPRASGPGSEADKRFRRGIELYAEGDFHAAIIEFRRAYELDPRYQALYNIGETYFQLQDYAGALATLEKYLRDGGDKIAPERRDEVQKEIEKLRARVASLEITTRLPGVDIAVDDQPAGRTPLTLTVSAGRRKLTASRAGKPVLTRVVEIAGGDVKKITLEIPEDRAEEASPRKVPAAPWIVTSVLTAGAVVTGALALSASGTLKDELARRPGDAGGISSARDKTFALSLTTDILAGSALVMAGVSIYFTVAAASPRKPPEERTGAARWIGVGRAPGGDQALSLTAGPRSLSVGGTF